MEKLEAYTIKMAIEESLKMAQQTQRKRKSRHSYTPPPQEDLEELELKRAIEASLAAAQKAKIAPKPSTRWAGFEVTSLWPKIEKWLNWREGPKPVVECFGCDYEVVIRGLQEDDGQREPALILGCGHVVGSNCFSWLVNRVRNVNSAEAKCPYCGQEPLTAVL
jgi:hypothetical protein